MDETERETEGEARVGVAVGVRDGDEALGSGALVAAPRRAQCAHRDDAFDRLADSRIDPLAEFRQEAAGGVEAVRVTHRRLQLRVPRGDHERDRERPAVADEGRVVRVPQLAARPEGMGALREVAAVPEAVVAAVVDDPDLVRLLGDVDPGVGEPVARPRRPPERIHDESGAQRAVRGHAGHSPVLDEQPVHPAGQRLDERLAQHRLAQRPLDQWAADAQEDELGVIALCVGEVGGDP